MMKSILFLLTATVAESFLIAPSSHRATPAIILEGTRWDKIENSVESDPMLADVVEPAKKAAKKVYVDKEAHRHDSLFSEIEHALETDPDLANMMESKKAKAINSGFMEKEAHVHDSLLNEIEHSLDNDPDLYSN